MSGWCRGTYIISWPQVAIDGVLAPDRAALEIGASWSWHGEPVRIGGPARLLTLGEARGAADNRRRAARAVRRLVGLAARQDTGWDTGQETAAPVQAPDSDAPLRDAQFIVSDGMRSHTVSLIDLGPRRHPLLMFIDDLPPRETPLWIVQQNNAHLPSAGEEPTDRGVICFTPGTMIQCEGGPRPVEALRPGDRVQTKDNGLQDILWTGARRMTGARLHALPHLRPIRLRRGAFGIQVPRDELLVSPDHRMLVKGAVARSLFNTDEVLVRAEDLVNGRSILRDSTAREVTYHHLMLPRHEILFANGVETESFHPANAALSGLADTDRAGLFDVLPEAQYDPHLYGDYARRNLSRSEAAILLHKAA